MSKISEVTDIRLVDIKTGKEILKIEPLKAEIKIKNCEYCRWSSCRNYGKNLNPCMYFIGE